MTKGFVMSDMLYQPVELVLPEPDAASSGFLIDARTGEWERRHKRQVAWTAALSSLDFLRSEFSDQELKEILDPTRRSRLSISVAEFEKTHFGKEVTSGSRSERGNFWKLVGIAITGVTPSDLQVFVDVEAGYAKEAAECLSLQKYDPELRMTLLSKADQKRIIHDSGVHTAWRSNVFRKYAAIYLRQGYALGALCRISEDHFSLTMPKTSVEGQADATHYQTLAYWRLFDVQSTLDIYSGEEDQPDTAMPQFPLVLSSTKGRGHRIDAQLNFEIAKQAYLNWPGTTKSYIEEFSERVGACCALFVGIYDSNDLTDAETEVFGYQITSGTHGSRVQFWLYLGCVLRGAQVLLDCSNRDYCNPARETVRLSAIAFLDAGHDPDGWYMLVSNGRSGLRGPVTKDAPRLPHTAYAKLSNAAAFGIVQ
jgi:hypothetical protein